MVSASCRLSGGSRRSRPSNPGLGGGVLTGLAVRPRERSSGLRGGVLTGLAAVHLFSTSWTNQPTSSSLRPLAVVGESSRVPTRCGGPGSSGRTWWRRLACSRLRFRRRPVAGSLPLLHCRARRPGSGWLSMRGSSFSRWWRLGRLLPVLSSRPPSRVCPPLSHVRHCINCPGVPDA